ncbi:hypothetical protein M0R45_001623 [Rubus argutus]|uniref:Uncharacterized protein n=1 Tax=Rubus argutus TaxID=59490 RepID=A0AAW1VLM9_RUBAR
MEMEMLVLCVLILFASLYYVFGMLISTNNGSYCRLRRGTKNEHELPPGSTGWPIIGEGLAFLMTAKRGAPENFIAERRIKYSKSSSSSCKVFTTSLLRESVAVLCSAAGNKFLFSNENKLVRSWWPRNIETIFPNSQKTNSADASIRLPQSSVSISQPRLSPKAPIDHGYGRQTSFGCFLDT